MTISFPASPTNGQVYVAPSPAGSYFYNATQGVWQVLANSSITSGLAPLASPSFTGTPAAPTATPGTNTTQIATTAFVLANGPASTATPLIDGTATAGSSTAFSRGDHVHPTDTTRASLASPTFTGTVTISGNLAVNGGVAANANPSISTSPTANPTGGSLLTTYAGIVSQGTTQNSGNREWQAIFGLTSNLGNGVANNNCDKVALYAGINALSGTGDVWAFNTVTTMNASSGSYNAQGYELDFNNNNAVRGSTSGPSGFTAPLASGLSVTGASSYASTTGILVSGAGSSQWERGLTVFGGCVQAGIAEYSSATVGIQMIGVHSSYGIDMQGSTLAGGMRFPNGTYFTARNGANTADLVLLYSDSYNNLTFGGGSAAIFMGTNVAPITDNTYTFGTGYNRWTAVYAVNGTIQTSDARLKTDIALLPTALPLVAALNPVTYRWKSGGFETREVEEDQLVHDTETLYHDTHKVEMRDGVAVRVPWQRPYMNEIYDEVPLFDEAGNPAVVHVPAKDAVVDKNGAEIHPAQAARDVAVTHRVPRMVTKKVTVSKQVEREGRRTHWGFLATDVKAAFEAHTPGMDFGGYVKDEGGTEHLRPDQLIAVLWKAVQELAEQVAALRAQK